MARESSVALPAPFLRDFDRLPTELKLNVESKLNLIPSSRRHWKSQRPRQAKSTNTRQDTQFRIFLWRLISSDNHTRCPWHPKPPESRMTWSADVIPHLRPIVMVFSWIINWTVCSFLDCTITKTLVNNSAATPVIYSCYAANGSLVSH